MVRPLIIELQYLQDLHRKYARYWKQYFGFTAKDIADYLGLTKNQFSAILRNRNHFPEELEVRLKAAFEEFKIMEQTRDFDGSPGQIWQRRLVYIREKQKKKIA